MTKLTQRSVKSTLFKMAFPMLAGTIAMNAYNLADTWFIGKLGTLPLAAMGFTFPVVILLTFVSGSIGTGVTTLSSHALGRHDQETASRVVTHGIYFTIIVATFMALIGYFSINTVFTLIGADSHTLPLIGEYMRMWYLGAMFMALPMMGNGVLIACGDSKSASLFMALGTCLNIILDPIMIFGFLGFPALGIFGAALATVIAQAIATIWLFYLLVVKHKLLCFKAFKLADFFKTCKDILEFAIPTGLSMMLMPISAAIITSLLSNYGHEAVAASGVATRIEMFAFVIPMALGMSLTPFISQNLGANRIDRIKEAKNIASFFAIAYGAFIAIIFYASAPYLAKFFTNNPKVIEILVMYIHIISFGYGMMEVHRYSGFMFTGMHFPKSATLLNIIRVVFLLIPLSFLGDHLDGIRGIFFGRLATDLIVGTIGIIAATKMLNSQLRTKQQL